MTPSEALLAWAASDARPLNEFTPLTLPELVSAIEADAVKRWLASLPVDGEPEYEDCAGCGHRGRSHGVTGTVSQGCWAAKCQCRGPRPPELPRP